MTINLYKIKGIIYLNKEKKIEIDKTFMAKDNTEAIKICEKTYMAYIEKDQIYATCKKLQKYDTKQQTNTEIEAEVIWTWPI